MVMIKNLVRTCDMCRREIPAGQYLQRNSERTGLDVLMVLLENQGRELQLIEMPDGSIALDTCRTCYSRMGFTHSNELN
jgi:hypothetical protein